MSAAPAASPPHHARSLAVLGAGGHGRSVADAAEAAGWTHVNLFDDGLWPGTRSSGPWPIVGNREALVAMLSQYAGVAVAIGDCAARLRTVRELQAAGAPLPALVHPSAWVSPHASLGPGCVVLAGAALNVGAALGEACIINTGATVDHDCDLGAGVHISPGAHLAGGVTVGECAWVGIGAAVKQGMRVGRGAVVGAGAVVVRGVDEGVCVVGCPARPIGVAAAAAAFAAAAAHRRRKPKGLTRLTACWRTSAVDDHRD